MKHLPYPSFLFLHSTSPELQFITPIITPLLTAPTLPLYWQFRIIHFFPSLQQFEMCIRVLC